MAGKQPAPSAWMTQSGLGGFWLGTWLRATAEVAGFIESAALCRGTPAGTHHRLPKVKRFLLPPAIKPGLSRRGIAA